MKIGDFRGSPKIMQKSFWGLIGDGESQSFGQFWGGIPQK